MHIGPVPTPTDFMVRQDLNAVTPVSSMPADWLPEPEREQLRDKRTVRPAVQQGRQSVDHPTLRDYSGAIYAPATLRPFS